VLTFPEVQQYAGFDPVVFGVLYHLAVPQRKLRQMRCHPAALTALFKLNGG
jgi:hypothetical protein